MNRSSQWTNLQRELILAEFQIIVTLKNINWANKQDHMTVRRDPYSLYNTTNTCQNIRGITSNGFRLHSKKVQQRFILRITSKYCSIKLFATSNSVSYPFIMSAMHSLSCFHDNWIALVPQSIDTIGVVKCLSRYVWWCCHSHRWQMQHPGKHVVWDRLIVKNRVSQLINLFLLEVFALQTIGKHFRWGCVLCLSSSFRVIHNVTHSPVLLTAANFLQSAVLVCFDASFGFCTPKNIWKVVWIMIFE